MILIDSCSVPSFVRFHLSFKSSDQVVLSSMDISGVILIFPGNVVVFKLDSSRNLSIVLLNLTRIGQGLFDFPLYLPSRI